MDEACGSSLFLALPDDIFALVTSSLSPRDVCNLGLCCRGLYNLVSPDKVWLAQCHKLGLVPYKDLFAWRKGICSYKALYKFLVNVQLLLGIWVHQNPELGNVVYVMPGFLSVVGCRIIPQEVGPLGLEHSPILWSLVFEIICNHDGSAVFFLHGREKGNDYVYPGVLKPVDKNCNVLSLEVELKHERNGGKLAHSKSFADAKISRQDNEISNSQRIEGQKGNLVSFSRLGFGDRRRLLDIVTSQVRLAVPDTANELVFPGFRSSEIDLEQDVSVLYERRLFLLQMYEFEKELKPGSEIPLHPTQMGSSEIRKSLEDATSSSTPQTGDEKRKSFSGILKNGFKQVLGKSGAKKGDNHEFTKKSFSSLETRHAQLHEFLKSSDAIGLSLRPTTMKLCWYRSWPNMPDSKFALYKLPMRAKKTDHKYAGLWGGTFGWPPGKPSEDRPGKALFFLLLSYQESESEGEQLVGTKILEGTSFVLHPNGSAMFIVNTSQVSQDQFPWNVDGDSNPVGFEGVGIAKGYGFRYPGSKPGSLFVVKDELLAFIWKESRTVLTLQRVNLDELLRKGERVPSLSPVNNFAYLTKTCSNVFAGFSDSSNGLS